MFDSEDKLKDEFRDREYREAYAEDFLNTSIATQITVLREQRGLTQEQLGELVGMQQEGISRIERVAYGRWNIATLRRIAHAFDARLKVSIETYSSLLEEVRQFSAKNLERPSFSEDPAFHANAEPPVSVPAEEFLRRQVCAWLEKTARDPNQLQRWLEGLDLPPLGHADEPYVHLWRSLPKEGDAKRDEFQLRMALSLQALLIQRPDKAKERISPERESMLRNLFQLAALLKRRWLLGEPIQRIYEDGLEKEPERLSRLTREMFFAAAVHNQHSYWLLNEFEQIVGPTGHSIILPVTPWAAMTATRHGPKDGRVDAMAKVVGARERCIPAFLENGWTDDMAEEAKRVNRQLHKFFEGTASIETLDSETWDQPTVGRDLVETAMPSPNKWNMYAMYAFIRHYRRHIDRLPDENWKRDRECRLVECQRQQAASEQLM